MSCDAYRELLSAWIDGELAAEERSRAEAHVASCAACRQALEELREMSAAIRGLPRERAPESVLESFRRKASCDAESVSASVDGRADAGKHLAACGDCRGRAEDWKEIARALRALPRAKAPASILQAVRAEMAKSNVIPLRRRAWFQYGVAAAATVVVTLNVIYVAGGFDRRKTAPAEVARAPEASASDRGRRSGEGEKLGYLEFKDGERQLADRLKEKDGDDAEKQFAKGVADAEALGMTPEAAPATAAPPAPGADAPHEMPPAPEPARTPALEPAVVMFSMAMAASPANDGRLRAQTGAVADEVLKKCETYVVESADKDLNGALVLSVMMTEDQLEEFKRACEAQYGVTLAAMDAAEQDKAQTRDREAEDFRRRAGKELVEKDHNEDAGAEETARDSKGAMDELERSVATHGYRLRAVEGKKAEEVLRRNLQGLHGGFEDKKANDDKLALAKRPSDPAAPAPAPGHYDPVTEKAKETQKEPAVGLTAGGTGGGAGENATPTAEGADSKVAGRAAAKRADSVKPGDTAKPETPKTEASKRLVRVVVWLMNPPAPEPATKPVEAPPKNEK